jgi:hypothetical protein
MMDETPKRFTVEQANALLPGIAPLLETLRDAQATMDAGIEGIAAAASSNGGGESGAAYLEASRAAGRCMGELENLGIVVRDPAIGLIDFPGERDGKGVFWCWRLGEDEIAWWHPTDVGFSGRQPL